MDVKYQVVFINRPEDTRRRENMIKRLSYHNLDEFVHIIQADDNNDEFSDFSKGIEEHQLDERYMRIMGSLLCHIKAMRYFVNESQCDQCLIMEDDAMLHKEFKEKLFELVANKPIEHDCILLAPYLIHQIERVHFVTAGLFNHYAKTIFGASCYWITKKCATKALERYDKPFRDWNEGEFSKHFTSEHLINSIGSYVSYPPLAIEESLDTNLQHESHMPHKKSYWSSYGFENYV